MNSDIRLSVGFFDHHKTQKLERQLGYEGVIALMRLWLWTAQNRPSGVLSGMDEDDIELVARWSGTQGAFNAATTAVKFLDYVDGVYHVHDWQEHNQWQAAAESRSNASRLSRMSKTYPSVYKALEGAGIKGISREHYDVITASNDPQAAVEQFLTTLSSPFLTSHCLSSPSPSLSSQTEAKSRKATPEPLSEDSEAYRLAVLMRDTLKASLPTFKEPDLQKWAQSFAVALRNDERMVPHLVAEVIRWACSDNFWRANIQNPDKLRQKFDQLTAKMEIAAEKAHTASKAEMWKSPAARRVEANQEAGKEAERLLFGDTPQADTEVIYDAS